ncbi:MAG: hypothetical protein AAF585_19650, partial [Verrucomicrobiota bacterium]
MNQYNGILLKPGFQMTRTVAAGLAILLAASAWADVTAPGKGTPTDTRRKGKQEEDMDYREEERIPILVHKKGKVLRGRSIVFLLETQGDLPAQRVEYQIRQLPEYGDLTEPADVPGRLSAKRVIYTPDTNREVPEDLFTFSAKYPDGKWAAAQNIEIEVATPQPVLQVPPVIHFGAVLVGQTGTQTVPIKNIGNDFFEGSLDVFVERSLWSWVPPEGKTTVRLEPEQQIMATFSFSPKAPGVKTTSLSYTPGFDNTVSRVSADGVIPFTVSRSKIELAFDPISRERVAHLTLSPRSTEDFELKVFGSDRLSIPSGREIFLKSGTPHQMEIRLPADDPMPFDEIVKIDANGFVRELKVTGQPAPPKLEVALKNTLSTTLDFGAIEPGEEISRVFGIRNLGGVATTAEFSLPGPFEIEDLEEVFEIPANAVRQFEVWFRPKNRGGFRETVQLAPNAEQLLLTLRGIGGANLLVDANMDFDKPTADPSITRPASLPGSSGRSGSNRAGSNITRNGSGGSRPGTPKDSGGSGGPFYDDLFKPAPPTLEELEDRASLAEDIPTEVVGVAGKIALPPMLTQDRRLAYSPFKTKTDPGLPRVERFGVGKTSLKSIQLIWPKVESIENYEVETRVTRFNPKKKRFEIIWVPISNAKIAINKEAVTAKIGGLKPNEYYNFRVFSIGVGGTNSFPSDEFGLCVVV